MSTGVTAWKKGRQSRPSKDISTSLSPRPWSRKSRLLRCEARWLLAKFDQEKMSHGVAHQSIHLPLALSKRHYQSRKSDGAHAASSRRCGEHGRGPTFSGRRRRTTAKHSYRTATAARRSCITHIPRQDNTRCKEFNLALSGHWTPCPGSRTHNRDARLSVITGAQKRVCRQTIGTAGTCGARSRRC